MQNKSSISTWNWCVNSSLKQNHVYRPFKTWCVHWQIKWESLSAILQVIALQQQTRQVINIKSLQETNSNKVRLNWLHLLFFTGWADHWGTLTRPGLLWKQGPVCTVLLCKGECNFFLLLKCTHHVLVDKYILYAVHCCVHMDKQISC
jgi:hypothetical protein